MSIDKKKIQFITSKLRAGKINNSQLRYFYKYVLNPLEREEFSKNLSPVTVKLCESIPLPRSRYELGSSMPYIILDQGLFNEVEWNLNLFIKYSREINSFLTIQHQIEANILQSNFEEVYELVDKLDDEVCSSIYSIAVEFYVNNKNNNYDDSRDILFDILQNNKSPRVHIILNFLINRIANKISAIQYKAIIDQHKSLYEQNAKSFLDYIDFKFINYENSQQDSPEFLLMFDDDLSIIDRYLNFKRVMPDIARLGLLDDEELFIVKNSILKISTVIDDPFWKNLVSIFGIGSKRIVNENKPQILELYSNGDFKLFLDRAKDELKMAPQNTYLYEYIVSAVIAENGVIGDYFKDDLVYVNILNLMYNLCVSNTPFFGEREKFSKEIMAISDFDFSVPLYNFLHKQFNFASSARMDAICNLFNRSMIDWHNIIDLGGGTSLSDLKLDNLIDVNFLALANDMFDRQNLLQVLESSIELGLITPNKYIQNELLKIYVLTSFNNGSIDLVANMLVNLYNQNKQTYDHIINEEIFEALIQSENDKSNINIPILTRLYERKIEDNYDAVSNFLISLCVNKPSELISLDLPYTKDQFLYFFEYCCESENLEDSPFYLTIEDLEHERISLLNFLKTHNKENIEKYNLEILEITKEANLRKGLLQIHESRIYVDEKSIVKEISPILEELFKQYIEATDSEESVMYTLKLDDVEIHHTTGQKYYYDHDNIKGVPDEVLEQYKVEVPNVKYYLFLTLFDAIKNEFLFNSDYGFKSFLSMRIRHGSFSNALRSVFEKKNLVGNLTNDFDTTYQDIDFWSNKNILNYEHFQNLLKNFSNKVDSIIENGLNWLTIDTVDGLFDFKFSFDDLEKYYKYKIGKIIDFNDFIELVLKQLFKKLELCLLNVREKIDAVLKQQLLEEIDQLSKDIAGLEFSNNELEEAIVTARTDIQFMIGNIQKWFNISKNQYIEEFPLELIVDTSLNYISYLYSERFEVKDIYVKNFCNQKFNGKFFEAFGDIFINLLDNVFSKNRSLGNSLEVKIEISDVDNKLVIKTTNSIDPENIDNVNLKVLEIKEKVEKYKMSSGLDSGFEKGSGYYKLCKSIQTDLKRNDYEIFPSVLHNEFTVELQFDCNGLI